MKDTSCFDELILLMTFGFNAEEKRCEIIKLISKHYNIDVYTDEDAYDEMVSRARSTKQCPRESTSTARSERTTPYTRSNRATISVIVVLSVKSQKQKN
jgi:hypothetical protein